MPGPCSNPNGNKAVWEEMNMYVCSRHRDEDTKGPHFAPCPVDECDAPVVVYRLWLAGRGRLVTGKTHGSRGA